MKEESFKAGEYIFREGDASDVAFRILSGSVKVTKEGHTDRSATVLAELHKDDVFGEMGIVSEQPRSASVIAKTNIVVQTITYEEFLALIIDRPHEGAQFLKVLFERMRENNSNNVMHAAVKKASPSTFKIVGDDDRRDPRDIEYKVQLVPLSKIAAAEIGQAGIEVNKFPYRVGRICHHGGENPLNMNDLSILDNEPYNVSRNHFSIEHINGHYIIRDRGSHYGLRINDEKIGGGDSDSMHHVIETSKTKIIVGSEGSPYRFGLKIEPVE